MKKSIFVILPIRGQWKCHFDPILTPFWALPKPKFWLPGKNCLFRPLPGWTLEGPRGDPQIWPYFDHFDPFLRGPGRRLQLDPIQTAFGPEGPAQKPHKPCPEPQILVIWPLLNLLWNLENDLIILALKPHDLAICSVQIGPSWRLWPRPCRNCQFWLYFKPFSYWKSQFCHFLLKKVNFGPFCLSGHSENAILAYFDPILSPPEPEPWPPAKMCLFWPTAWMDLGGTLRDPILTLILTILDPFEGPGRTAAGLPHVRAAFGLEDLLRASQTHARDPKFWSFWPLLTSCENLENDLILDHLASNLRPGDLLCPDRALLEHLA